MSLVSLAVLAGVQAASGAPPLVQSRYQNRLYAGITNPATAPAWYLDYTNSAGLATVGGFTSSNTAGPASTSRLVIAESSFAEPIVGVGTDFQLGDELTPPGGVDLAVNPVLDFLGGSTSAAWIVYAQKLIATDMGAVKVAWTLLNGSTQEIVYTLSPNPTKRPVRLYWTEGQNAGPAISFGSNYRVDIFYNSQIKTSNDVWIAYNTLHANTNTSGRFLLTYSQLDEMTRARKLLAYEVVDVLAPMSSVQEVNVGDRLLPLSRPYGTDDLVAEVTRGAMDPAGMDTPFVYVHDQGYQNGWVWAVRETAAAWQIEIYWKAKEELDVLWPFEVDIYSASWGTNGQQYIRGDLLAGDFEPRVYMPRELVVAVMPHQKPEGHAVLQDSVFYTADFGNCLLKYSYQDRVWFEAVRSVSRVDPSINRSNINWTIASELRPVAPDTLARLESSHGVGPAYIYKPSGTAYNVNKYAYPSQYAVASDVESYVFPVNKGTLELWWGNESSQTGLPMQVFFPSLVNVYSCDWPLQAKEIVIASGLGNEGYTLNIDNTGCAGFDHSGMPIELIQMRVCHLVLDSPNSLDLLNALSLEMWVKPATLTGIQYLVNKGENYRLRLTNGVPELRVGGRWYRPALPSGTTLQAGLWQHLAVTVASRGTIDFYLDGRELGSVAFEGWLTSDGAPLRIGARADQADSPVDFFSGLIDEVRIWSRKRTTDEVRSHMIATVPASTPGLRAYYRFEPDELSAAGYARDSSDFINNIRLPTSGVTFITPGIRQIESGIDLDGLDPQIYVQNVRTNDGFNPNEEHAFVVGNTAFALRCDLNRTNSALSDYTSKPFVLLDCRSDAVNNGRPFMYAFTVIPSNELYRFEKYQEAGLMIQAPVPLNLMMPDNCSSNRQVSGPEFRDRKGYYWAKQAGNDGGVTNYVFQFYYPMQSSFFFPGAISQPAPGFQVAWLSALTGTGNPIDYTFKVEWPDTVPVLNICETLANARGGLPAIRGQLSVKVVYQQSLEVSGVPSVQLIDPTVRRTASLSELPPKMKSFRDVRTGYLGLADLPPALRARLCFNPMAETGKELQLVGLFRDRSDEHDYFHLNVLDNESRAACTNATVVAGIAGTDGGPWNSAVGMLPTNTLAVTNDTIPFDSLALPTVGLGAGYVTVVFNNSTNTDMVPSGENVDMEIFRVSTNLYRGRLEVILSSNPLDKQQEVYYTADFQGHPERWEFKWEYAFPVFGAAPAADSANWLDYGAGSGPGKNHVTIGGEGTFGLSDHYLRCSYRALDPAVQSLVGTNYGPITPPVLCEGWIKRVLKAINPYEQRIRDYMNYAVNMDLSMLQQIGEPYNGDVPLNYEALNQYGLMQIYETINRQADDLSVNVDPIVDDYLALALLMVKGRLSDLYMVLGNEAYGDALNSSVLLGGDDPVGAGDAPSLFCFQNQYPDLLSEELGLLRGRDDTLNPPVADYPLFNRLPWNITADIVGGQLAYMLNYGISDLKGNTNGVLDAADARALFPQGHGDAYGHYLSALKGYYTYMHNPNFSWKPQTEGILVGDTEVGISMLHEKRFAMAAVSRARAGIGIMDRTWRASYVEEDPWTVAIDSNTNRAWGVGEWSSRAGMGAYFDWLTANSLVPDTDAGSEGIRRIDRVTMPELSELAGLGRRIQEKADFVDAGLNPLGLAINAVPFDISSDGIDDGKTHFEQVYERALAALRNAAYVHARIKTCSQAIRDQNESADLDATVQTEEAQLTRRLIEIYGYPYEDDMGPGKIYPQGYNGPDLLHYMYVDSWPLSTMVNTDTRTKSISLTNYVYALSTNTVELSSKQRSFMSVFYNGALNVGVNAAHLSLMLLPPYTTASLVFQTDEEGWNPLISLDWLLGEGTKDVDLVSAYYQSNNVADVSFSVAGNGIPVKPDTYTGKRRAEGEVQIAVSEYLTSVADLYKALGDAQFAAAEVDREGADWLATMEHMLLVRETTLAAQSWIRGYEHIITLIRTGLRIAHEADSTTRAMQATVIEYLPKVVGLATDATSPARGTASLVWTTKHILTTIGTILGEGTIAGLEAAIRSTKDDLERDLLELELKDEGRKAMLRILSLMDKQINSLHSVEAQLQRVETARMRLMAVISEGDQLQIERERLRMNWASDLNARRYRNMAYRMFLNDDLVRYDQSFDLAARYVYLAAKAYDYETGLLEDEGEGTAGREFMRQIVKARALGRFSVGANGLVGDPLVGGSTGDPGLADIMARMDANWTVLKGRLSFNNPQQEAGRFSLRTEFFRISPDSSSDADWRAALEACKVDNLRIRPEFQQYCIPFAPIEDREPGIVIPFSTTIEFRKNFFGKTLAAGDNAYDSTHFATKIRSVGVWFSNFDALATNGLANQPRIYLLPVGVDRMRVPMGASGARIRDWQVVDQAMPLPYPVTDEEWSLPDWSMLKNNLGNELYTIRRFPSMLAYHDGPSDPLLQVTWNSRLIGRSVWNSQWVLVIPGGTLLADQDEGIARFIYGKQTPSGRDLDGVKDIKIYFHTYSYSGN